MARLPPDPIIAAIDVGTNAVRLEIARVRADGSLEILQQDRDPVRPGEGLFTTGSMPRGTADRLLAALRRYGALCRRYKARVRAVATSAVREARNREEIIRRVQAEAGIRLEAISGQEEARLICLGVLHGVAEGKRSVVVDIGGGSTEVASALGQRPLKLWSVAVGAVRLTELFASSKKVNSKKLKLMRTLVREAFEEAIPRDGIGAIKHVLGSSGTIEAVVSFAAPSPQETRATLKQVSKAVDEIAQMSFIERRRHFDTKRAEIIVAGGVILEAVMRHLRLKTVTAVDRGLRDGVLFDLVSRSRSDVRDPGLTAAAIAFHERFRMDTAHALKVAEISLALFDDLATMHRLPASMRPVLETAALLHDIGHAVNYQRHHKHAQYMIRNADIPGLNDRERELAALTARFHRRSPPEPHHVELRVLSDVEIQAVRKLSTLLRIADSLDRGHHQNVTRVGAQATAHTVKLQLRARAAVDLELWDTEHEAPLFRRVFHKRLELAARRG